jgi:hypothetical protein
MEPMIDTIYKEIPDLTNEEETEIAMIMIADGNYFVDEIVNHIKSVRSFNAYKSRTSSPQQAYCE